MSSSLAFLGAKQKETWARLREWDPGSGLEKDQRSRNQSSRRRERSVRGRELRDSEGTWRESVSVHLDM